MKVTVFLKKDHEALRELFAEYAKSTRTKGKGMFQEIQREILIHSQMEAEIFYPALQNTASIRAAELTQTATEDHRVIDGMIEELAKMNEQDQEFDKKMTKLIEAVGRHIDTEEEELFDEARKNLSEFRLEELGLEMEDRRRILSDIAA